MTQDEIIEMARQAGGIDLSTTKGGGVTVWIGTDRPKFLEAFAKLVDAKATAKEREACAKVCDNKQYVHPYHDLGTLIRARGEPTSRGEA